MTIKEATGKNPPGWILNPPDPTPGRGQPGTVRGRDSYGQSQDRAMSPSDQCCVSLSTSWDKLAGTDAWRLYQS